MGTIPKTTGIQARLLLSPRHRADNYITAWVSSPHSLVACRNDNPHRDRLALHWGVGESQIFPHFLYGPGSKPGIWCERNHRELPYLSAYLIQMVPKYHHWHLRRWEDARYIHCRLKSSTRYCACGLTHPNSVEIATCKYQEGAINLHVRNWYHVWHPNPPALIARDYEMLIHVSATESVPLLLTASTRALQ